MAWTVASNSHSVKYTPSSGQSKAACKKSILLTDWILIEQFFNEFSRYVQ